MKKTQLNKGMQRRVMYVESKDAPIDGAHGRIGWVTFSKTGRTIYYRDKVLTKGSGVSGNFFDTATGEEYWISGVKKRGSNAHYAEPIKVVVDDDAADAYKKIKAAPIKSKKDKQ
jgi:hypothetical protein